MFKPGKVQDVSLGYYKNGSSVSFCACVYVNGDYILMYFVVLILKCILLVYFVKP